MWWSVALDGGRAELSSPERREPHRLSFSKVIAERR